MRIAATLQNKLFVTFVVRNCSQTMEQTERSTSPVFYKKASIAFFVIAIILTWQAIAHKDWTYAAFAGITFVNGVMTTLKAISLRETKQ
jgi:drug/metabolite transporter superfamily protein YnfA